MSYVVLEHAHDTGNGTYRLVLGWREVHSVQALDDDGKPLFNEPEDGEAEPIMGEQSVDRVLAEYVWADDAEEWQGLSDEKIAEAQRKAVSDAIVEREQGVPEEQEVQGEEQPLLRALPGSGDALTF